MDLLAYLKQQDIPLSTFAEEIGEPQPSLWRYAHGERRIPADIAAKIEKATGGEVRVKDLIAARRRHEGHREDGQ